MDTESDPPELKPDQLSSAREPEAYTVSETALDKARERVARLESEAEIRAAIQATRSEQPDKPESRPASQEDQEAKARAELEELKRQLQAAERPPDEPRKTM